MNEMKGVASPRRVGPMEGYFTVTDGELPSTAANEANTDDSTLLSEHERALLSKARTFQQSKQTYVIVDKDSREIRMGNDRIAVREATPGADLERIYFHEVAKIVTLNDSTLKVVKKKAKAGGGLEKVFTGKQCPELREALEKILNPPNQPSALSHTERSSEVAANTSSADDSSSSYVTLLSVPLFSVALQVIAAHAILSPFTKVEESFNVQGTHDMIRYPEGLINTSVIAERYDHVEFPGVVPRTFTGPLILSSFHRVLEAFIPQSPLHDSVVDLVIIRLVLGILFVGMSISALYHSAHKAFPNSMVPVWYLLLQISQFHVPFYCTRLLPNTFAMVLCTLAQAHLLLGRKCTCLALMIVTFVVFRCDVLVLLAPTAVWVWLSLSAERGLSIPTLLKVGFGMFFWGLFVFLTSLAFTVGLDTHMWNRPWSDLLWPEGMVLFFNTVLNKSSEWGTQPFHWYFTSALPRALLVAFPLIPFGVASSLRTKNFVGVAIPSLVFVALYSALPHKEVRFLFPVLPALTLTAAVGFESIQRRAPRAVRQVLVLGFFLACVVSLVLSGFYSYVSSMNYPGGYALQWLHRNVQSSSLSHFSVDNHQHQPIKVHIDVYSAMSGVSRFGYVVDPPGRFVYSKQEKDVRYQDFDYLLTNNPAMVSSLSGDAFRVIHNEPGEPRVILPSRNRLQEILAGIPRSTFPGLMSHFIQTRPVVFVMQRKTIQAPRQGTDEEVPSASAY